MENKDIEMARCYYEILRNKVALANMQNTRLDIFHERLVSDGMDCMNYDGELFDVNYGNICATIIYRNNQIKLNNSVEIWNENDIIDSDYRFAY